MAATPVVTGITQILIPCKEVPRAVAFYRDVLGIPLLFEAGPLAFFQCGTTRLMIGIPETPEIDHPSSIVYFTTGDIEASAATLTAKGARVVNEPHLIANMGGKEIWLCEWHDTEGNVMAFMEERIVA
jgi:methylmalonyl-CoA/ethylmalonyl-CoA epimerase